MKKVFELCYRLEDGADCRLIFSSKRKATNSFRKYYAVGVSAYIVERILH